MKRKAIFTLIKHLILAGTTGAFAYFALLTSLAPDQSALLAFLIASIPFGWRWASTFITAVSLRGIGIKLLISLFLGWIAIFVVLISDIIRCIFTPKNVIEEAV